MFYLNMAEMLQKSRRHYNGAISSIDWFARQFLINILNMKLKSDVGVLHTLNDWDGIFLKTIGM